MTIEGINVEDYLPTAQVAARRFQLPPTPVFDYDDFLGAAYLELCEAALTFDPSRASFKTYAQMRVNYMLYTHYRRQFRGRQEDTVIMAYDPTTMEEMFASEGDREYLKDLLDDVSLLERDVIVGIYWYGMTVKDLAKARRVTTTAISHLHESGLKKMRWGLEGGAFLPKRTFSRTKNPTPKRSRKKLPAS